MSELRKDGALTKLKMKKLEWKLQNAQKFLNQKKKKSIQ